MARALTRMFLRSLSLTALVLLPAVLLMPHAANADGTTDGLLDIELAKMPLPQNELGAEFSGFDMDAGTGFGKCCLDATGFLNGYVLGYEDFNETHTSGPVFVASEVLWFNSSSNAAAFVADGIDQYNNDPSIVSVNTYPVTNLGDEATTIVANFLVEGQVVQTTQIAFIRDGLLGVTGIIRLDKTDVRSEVEQLGRDLDVRMKGVLTNDITGFPDRLPPDGNCDGHVDSIDASLDLQRDAGFSFTMACGALADANRDGVVNSIDASLVLQLNAGLTGWPP